MSDAEFQEVIDDEFIPAASARFGKRPVTFLESMQAVAIPPTVYEWFEDYRLDQWPPKSQYLSPFSSIWSSIERSINNLHENKQPKNTDDLWELIEKLWGTRDQKPEYWKQLIETLQKEICVILRKEV